MSVLGFLHICRPGFLVHTAAEPLGFLEGLLNSQRVASTGEASWATAHLTAIITFIPLPAWFLVFVYRLPGVTLRKPQSVSPALHPRS